MQVPEFTETSQAQQGHSQGEGGKKGKYWELANGKLSFSPGEYSGYVTVIS